MIDRAASLQPARAPKQQIPLAPCKGRGRFPAHEEDRLCLPSGSAGSFLGKATSTTDYRSTVNQTNKQTNNSAACGDMKPSLVIRTVCSKLMGFKAKLYLHQV